MPAEKRGATVCTVSTALIVTIVVVLVALVLVASAIRIVREYVVRHAPCPVLVMPRLDDGAD
jgi:hypothetical protein